MEASFASWRESAVVKNFAEIKIGGHEFLCASEDAKSVHEKPNSVRFHLLHKYKIHTKFQLELPATPSAPKAIHYRKGEGVGIKGVAKGVRGFRGVGRANVLVGVGVMP